MLSRVLIYKAIQVSNPIREYLQMCNNFEWEDNEKVVSNPIREYLQILANLLAVLCSSFQTL